MNTEAGSAMYVTRNTEGTFSLAVDGASGPGSASQLLEVRVGLNDYAQGYFSVELVTHWLDMGNGGGAENKNQFILSIRVLNTLPIGDHPISSGTNKPHASSVWRSTDQSGLRVIEINDSKVTGTMKITAISADILNASFSVQVPKPTGTDSFILSGAINFKVL